MEERTIHIFLKLCRERWPKFDQVPEKVSTLGRWNSQLSMNTLLLILMVSNTVKIEPRFILHLKAEVSKVDYSSRAKGSNVRGVGAFNRKIYVIRILH